MWLQDVAREDLLNLIQSDRLPEKPLRQLELINELPESQSELQFIWREDPRQWGKIPSVIVLDKITPREFFAWTGTYLNYCRPLTAHCHVVNREIFQAAIETHTHFTLGNLETICIGMIIGEAATYLAGQSDINRLSMTAFAGTYSFTMSRAVASNMVMPKKDGVGELWLKARRLTGQKLLSLSIDDLDQVWRTVFDISKHSHFKMLYSGSTNEIISSACRQISITGEISEDNWRILTRDLFEKNVTNELLKGPREERVIQVEKALTLLSQQSGPDKVKLAFIGGYLASRIAPGTFDHYELLIPYLSKLPTLLIWYGLFAGLSIESKLRNFGFGIGRRIVRDIVQEDSILNRPKCDISIGELEVLYGGNAVVQNLHPKESGHLIIELLPCLNSTMRNIEGRQNESRPNQQQQTLLPGYKDSELNSLLIDLDRSLKSVEQIRDRICEITGYGGERKKRDNNKVKNNKKT
ncbi:MAG: hypothetical protein RIN56_13125 [Sporomusaceae bacterium]|nr:hypothetical protein [Sporomusaceae bacterium]